MSTFWDSKFEDETYRYGTEPNAFVKDQIEKPQPNKNKAFFPFEGEGRNAVYAASLGWDVTAFDGSRRGREKAMALAEGKDVSIEYHVADVAHYELEEEAYDLIVLCYAHMPRHMRSKAHRSLAKALKPGGKLILEAFSKDQLERKSGGPKNVELLFSKDELASDFNDLLDISLLEETDTVLDEGEGHRGEACVVRLTGIRQ